ncbi:MAG: cytochrome [Bdellovibrionaceae bacterium]|nr:cytochrome [Pseudobdellovibrionaceae bacterium]|tara:strand:+ start:83 stop:361 length:279 start_codon:yes stop_codon:yes gene_type:complete
MYLQGDLQTVFDALYHMGVIDPVLNMDWSEAMDDLPTYHDDLNHVVTIVNSHKGSMGELMSELGRFDNTLLGYLAMEVAREFADFHSRDSLH